MSVILPNSQHTTQIKYNTIYDTNDLVIGNCTIYSGNKLFIHYHDIDEIYIITEGIGEVYNGEKWVIARKGDIFKFKAGTYHGAMAAENYLLKFTYMFFTGPFNTIKYHVKSNL